MGPAVRQSMAMDIALECSAPENTQCQLSFASAN
jgi:hypothetical protein